MLEIAILVLLAGKIGKIADSKGRKKIGYQLLLVGLWIGGELFGAVAGAIIAAIAGSEDAMLFLLACGYGCAALGAVIAFQIAKNMPPIEKEDDYYQGIDYADRLGASDHFGSRAPATQPDTEAIRDSDARASRPIDPHIQK